MKKYLRPVLGFLVITGFFIFVLPAEAKTNAYDIVIQQKNGNIKSEKIKAPTLSQALKIAKKLPGALRVEKNIKYKTVLIPNDPDYSLQWGLSKIGAPIAWDTLTDASSITVAVLDSGVDITNPDLADNIWLNPEETSANSLDDDVNGYIDDIHGWNFIENSNDPRPQVTEGATTAGIHHGTVIAGIIGARGNNGLAGTGTAWNVKILPVRVLDSTGSGDTVTVAKGITYAVNAGAKIINLSFVGSGTSPTLAATIESARKAGVLVIAAAGNENLDLDTDPQYPVCYSGVVGVASVGENDVKSTFSNYGSCIDISAPGENIYSTLFYQPGKNYTETNSDGWYGTSVASPLVAGAAALLEATAPNLTVDEIENILKEKAIDISSLNPDYINSLGSGRLSIENLLVQIKAAQNQKINILTSPQAGDTPKVREYSKAGKIQNQFITSSSKNQKGVVVASGDLDANGQMEIVTAFQKGADSTIRVYDKKGDQLTSFYAYAKSFKGGVSLAIGDVNADGKDEIVTGTDTGKAHIRIFDLNGLLISQFSAFTSSYSGGVRLAIGDVNADGKNEIIISKASKEPRVAIYDIQGKQANSFRAFPLKIKEGLNIAAGDVNGDGKIEIIVGLIKGSPRVRVFSDSGKLLSELLAYDKSQTGGVNVASADINSDGIDDIITGTGQGAKPEIRVFRNLTKQRIVKFLAYTLNSKTGVRVASIVVK
ncbi:MAG: S8 family serine peptidase [Patescibacteria group bacterium]|jgi:subtilisin family serine protease